MLGDRCLLQLQKQESKINKYINKINKINEIKKTKQKNGGGASQDWGGEELGTPCVGPQLEAPVCAFRALRTHPGLYV